MDCKSSCILHPRAQEILFEQKRKVSHIFREVIGHYEIDHLSIAVIKKNNELFFLSSTPSIEFNLIEQDIWAYDGSYHSDFFQNPQCQLWSALYNKNKSIELRMEKQVRTGFTTGFSASLELNDFYLVYSFATKSKATHAEIELFRMSNTLIKLGNFCFKKIAEEIFPDLFSKGKATNLISTPSMKLVVDNGLLLD